MSVLRISQLFLKPEREAAMTEQTYLDLDPAGGIIGSAPSILPRQVNIAAASSLETHGVSAAGSRANIIFGAPATSLSSGAHLTIGLAQLRITFPCEPCAHGARLAGVPLGRFRQLDRYLAVVTVPGRISLGQEASIKHDVHPRVPEDFKSRAAWAVGQIPAGRVVSSREFLAAIGASRSYHRALPGWLRQAVSEGLPGHRVLPIDFGLPSWSPDAARILADEGLPPGCYHGAAWPLTSALWGAAAGSPRLKRGGL
ncbi:hypothetical protein CS0771_02270 [Catellatospora sp. IY07-71]|uniref:hypothetical protein n=1 Tax=Catellatospora sp. IY07-71 TaxID=2728827 RepID=UPI001BB41947|nr:hypothetical protein [Catellatospora sp. IY07-71]BCJ70683.1 hypothetical protein CS0771_02270 [Catellatospora sp. IY07-71]